MFKTCSQCKLQKDTVNFYKRSKNTDGLSYQCKPCEHDTWKKWKKKQDSKTVPTKLDLRTPSPEIMFFLKNHGYSDEKLNKLDAYDAFQLFGEVLMKQK